MTQQEWLASKDPMAMMDHLKIQFHQPSDRKLRLFACACCRLTQSMHYPRAQAVVKVAEEASEEPKITRSLHRRLSEARQSIDAIRGWFWCVTCLDIAVGLRQTLYWECTERGDYGDAGGTDRSQIANLARDIFGNPFHPVILNPSWLIWHSGLLVSMARRMYDSRDFSDIPVLADALEEAGCTNPDVLSHCRQQGAIHVRGCWLIDLLLNKA